MSYIQSAFQSICNKNEPSQQWAVVLTVQTSVYGGPEEGGWWRESSEVVAYQWYQTKGQAKYALKGVQKLAAELNQSAQAQYGEYCQNTLEMLENRGLEPSFLAEPDGPEVYNCFVSREIPHFASDSSASREYAGYC